MGRPKALLPGRSGRPLLREWVELARAAGMSRPWVVLGGHQDLLRPHLPDWAQLHVNPNWAQGGITDSLREVWPKLRGRVLFTPVDLPPCTPASLVQLAQGEGCCALSHGGQLGHPAALEHTPDFPVQRSLHEVMLSARGIPAHPDCLLNWNTPAAYQAWLERLD